LGSEKFTIFFDVLVSGFKDWSFPAFGLIFVGVGLLLFFGPTIITRLGVPSYNFPSVGLTIFRYVYLGFALVWTITAFAGTYSAYLRHRDLAEGHACALVEGEVKDFVPMPFTGHADESFSVSGVPFSYSDYKASDAFNNTSSHGGPIKPGSYVRICYDPSDHAILILEIRGFNGKAKDYSHSGDSFPGVSDSGTNPAAIKVIRSPEWIWLADLWVSFYFLDVVATVAIFLPYLRTFWCLKVIPLRSVGVPSWLEPGQKTKLSNSLVYWDIDRGAIWLRARGLNFFRVLGAVAKLTVDESSRAIGNLEIRFSSGIPIIFLLFFASAYLIFSTAEPKTGPFPTPFIALFAAAFLIGAFFQRRRLISRMKMLAQDAVGEFEKGSESRSAREQIILMWRR
jgi:hypothetical protein